MRLLHRIHVSLIVSLLFLTIAHAQSAAPALPFTLKPLGPNTYAAIDDAKGEAGANAGFLVTASGVVVIDTFENEAAARQLLAEIRKLTQLPVKFVVNTHYHLDHVAGNKIFHDAGAVIVSQRNVPAWLHTENLKFFGDKITPEQKALVADLVPPSRIYATDDHLPLGLEIVNLKFYPGHTGGDSIVIFPSAKVIFCGDLFWNKTLPNLVDASTDRWIVTLSKLAGAPYSDYTFVPGHGDVGNASDVLQFQSYLQTLRSLLAAPVKEGKTGDELVNAVMPRLKEKYGSWNFFSYFSRPNILDTAAELKGTKKIPVPQTAPPGADQ
jgi:cyclase